MSRSGNILNAVQIGGDGDKGRLSSKANFHYRTEASAMLTGDFDGDGWDEFALVASDKKGDGNYSATILLAPGVYEYKFIVNDTWSIDPNCAEWVQNSFGTLNSVIHV